MKASAWGGYAISSFGTGRRSTVHTPTSRGPRVALFVTLALLVSLAVGSGSALAATPELKIDPTVTAGYATVEVSGEIDPNGDPLIWFLQISEDGGVSWREGFEFGESAIGEIGESEASTPKKLANLVQKGLAPGTTYKVRLSVFDFTTEELLSSAEPSPEFTTKSVAAPSATLDPITTKTDTTAVFKATVDPNSPGSLDEEDKNLFATEYAFHCSPECPGLSGGTVPAEASGSELEVEAHATELEPNTEYTVTLSATNRGGEATGGPQTFETDAPPPTVVAGTALPLGGGDMQIAGTVNPHNSAITTCLFEFGTTTAYGQAAACEAIPSAVNKAVFVAASLAGLEPGTEYHFRLKVASAAGPATSLDASFIAPAAPCMNEAIREEQGSTYLPECRAYEQVSPVFKEGFAAAPIRFTDGRLIYLSNGNYANNGNGSGGLPGGNAYLATRTGSGWSTTPLAPSGPDYVPSSSEHPASNGPAVPRAYSSDLRSTLWDMRRGDQPGEVQDLYVRDPGGTFTRIGDASDQPRAEGGASTISGSGDLSHVLFSTESGETYEYVGAGGPRRLVNVDNSGQPLAEEPECGSTRTRGVSADGRVIFFACRKPVSDNYAAVYARVGGTTTIDVSGSQCTRGPSDVGGACNAHLPAAFVAANADGTRVYLSTAQQLVNGDTDETTDLYECDIPTGTLTPVGALNPCPDLREVSGAETGANVQEFVRVSDDGARAYFVATGVLAPNSGANGAPAMAGDQNLYVWTRDAAHPAGETRFVGKLAPGETRMAQTTDDGRYLVIATDTQLIDHGPQADADATRDIYRYDAETGALTRLSVDSNGQGGNEPGRKATIISYSHGAISDDGASVAFTTDEALAPSDANGTVDVYLWHGGAVSLISSGKPSDDRDFLLGNEMSFGTIAAIQGFISPSGRDVFFTTTRRMVSDDVDTAMDIYVARVDGGFAPSETSSCIGESCRGASAPSPPTTPRPTTQGPGTGNPDRRKSCPKGKVRKHGQCVKKHGKRHKAKKHGKRHGPPKHRNASKGGQR